MVKVPICIDSGNKPSELCSKDPRGSRVRTEYFKKGTEPSSVCRAHVLGQVDNSSGLLATKHCPSDSLENRIFISRSAVSDTRGNIGTTGDSKYDVNAQKYCDIHSSLQSEEQVDFEDPGENEDLESDNSLGSTRDSISDNRDTDSKDKKDSKDSKDSEDSKVKTRSSSISTERNNE
jgi:penicillin-binding protein 1A